MHRSAIQLSRTQTQRTQHKVARRRGAVAAVGLLFLCFAPGPIPADAGSTLSGHWILDVGASDFGALPVPDRQEDRIAADGERITIRRTVTSPSFGTRESEFELPLDGTPGDVVAGGKPATGSARMECGSMVLSVRVEGEAGAMTVADRLAQDGDRLTVDRRIDVPGRDPIHQRLVYRRAAPEAASDASPKPPSAAQLVDRMIDALGGRRALSSLDSVHQVGTVTIPSLGLEGTVDLRWRSPDHLVMHTEFPGLTRVSMGHDGQVVWLANEGEDPRRLAGAEAQDFLALADFRGPLTYRERFRHLEVEGRGERSGRPCWILRLDGDDGLRVRVFVDAETYLAAGLDRFRVGGPDVVSSEFRAYDQVDGVRLLTSWTVDAGTQVQGFELPKISLGPHPENAFEPPAALGYHGPEDEPTT